MEAIFELIFEIFGELIVAGLGFVFDKSANKILNNTKAKKITKFIIGSILFAIGVVFLSISISYKKEHLILVSLVFLLSFIIFNFIIFLNNNAFNKKWINVSIKIVKSILRYVLILLLIYFANKDLTKSQADKILIISILAIIFCMIVDISYIVIAIKRKREAQINEH